MNKEWKMSQSELKGIMGKKNGGICAQHGTPVNFKSEGGKNL